MQLVYEGKTTKCHPAVEFPKGWHVTHTPNHWCNEETMVAYIESVIVPYMIQKRRQLGLDLKHTGLVILDEFKGQTTSRVLNLLQSNDLMYIIVHPIVLTGCNRWMSVSIDLPSNFFEVNLKTGMQIALLQGC